VEGRALVRQSMCRSRRAGRWHDDRMGQGFGIERPPAHRHAPPRAAARYLVLIESGGAATALLFTEARELAGDIDAGSEEVAVMVRGLRPVVGAGGAEWDRALTGHGAAERAAAEVYTLDV
jgi:hypothetical protein